MSYPKLLILNQMAGPMTWELAEDAGRSLGCVAVLTGHPDTLAKGSSEQVRLYPAAVYQRGSFTRRAISWLCYAVQAFFWLWRWPADTPVLLFSNPPILCWVGWLLKKLRRQQYAVMVHDIYPDVLVKMAGFSESHLLIRLWRRLNRCAYQNARVVMTLGELMAANLERQFDATKTCAGKVEIVYPWVDTGKIKPIPKEENWFAQKYDQVGKLTVMYSGNMGLGHDIETMLGAAQHLRDQSNVHFMFIGAGPKWTLVEDTIQRDGLTNVTLLPWQSEDVLPYSLAAADVALISLEPGLEGLAVPSKAIYAMGAGAVLLVLSDGKNDLVNWVETFSCGVLSRAESHHLAHVISGFTQDRAKYDTRAVAGESFSRRANGHRLLTKLSGLNAE
ncbi:MAG: glycosyltransferase family 4 protein [Anaerolineae bacterium]|nr:glycosyltransferase family 4 protein [Anaerolineae bacterium]